MSNASDFVIENGVLTKYVGAGGTVVIPEGVTTIKENALWMVGKPRDGIIIPESVVTLEKNALYGWDSAKKIHIPGTLCKNLGLRGIMKAFGAADAVFFTWHLLDESADYSAEFRDTLIANMLTKRFRQNNMHTFLSYRSDLLKAYISYWKKISLEEIDSYIDYAQKRKEPNVEAIALLMEYKNKYYSPKDIDNIEQAKQDMDLGIKERTVAEWRKIFKCTIQNGCVTITEYRGTDIEITIPEKIGKNTVTAIGFGAFRDRKDIISVSIPKSVVSIGERAFSCCEKLCSISIPDSVSEIGHFAFFRCKELKEFRIPTGLTTLGEAVFSDCNNLKTISIQKDHPAFAVYDGMIFDRNMKTLYLATESVPEKISIPETVTHIMGSAFFSCNAVKSVCLPESMVYIGHSAFAWCESLDELALPRNLTEMGEGMLRNCKKLTKVVVPNGVTSIPAQFVAFCDSLSSVVLPDCLKSIEEEAFLGCSSLHEITIPASVKKNSFNWNSISGMVIHGKQGSSAEKYAKKYGVPFVAE